MKRPEPGYAGNDGPTAKTPDNESLPERPLLLVFSRFSLRLEARCLGSLMLFRIIEDFLWFALNPAFGLSRLTPQAAPRHIHWFSGFPPDYSVFSIVGAILIFFSFSEKGPRRQVPRDRGSDTPASSGTG